VWFHSNFMARRAFIRSGVTREPTLREDRRWHGGKILVAEDNFLLGEVVCDFLRECGLEPIGPLATVEGACEVANHYQLDGAVLDLKLGRNLCFPVCALLDARRIPFIFLTGYGDLSMIPMELRAVPVICKPFESGEMKSALAAMLRLDEALCVSDPASSLRN
jgi:DNA-binding response OmpR family regulator